MWSYGQVNVFVCKYCNVSGLFLIDNLFGVEVELLHIHLAHINNIMQPTQHQIYSDVRQQTYEIYKSIYFPKFKRQPDYTATVICSFSLWKQGQVHVKVVSVGFGTKSLPQSLAKQHKGKVIKDMHAQILARRGLIKYLIQQLPKTQTQNQIFIWDSHKKKHKLKEQYSLIMFTNEIFCGDCMVDQSQNMFSGARPLKYYLQKQIPQQKYSQHCLRTKPGRFDLPLDKRTLSLSCSDKVGVWNILGIQGKMLFNYIKPIYINIVVLETQKTVDVRRIEEGINLSFRIQKLFPLKHNIDSKLFKIVVQGKTKSISSQFHCAKPKIVLQNRVTEHKQQKVKKQDLCGIISCDNVSWLNGRTGLPEGVNIQKMTNKVSLFCSQKLYENLKQNEQEVFKYRAVKERIKLLFEEWTNDYRTVE